MSTIRNYNAWIKAARKASAKTGGLSLPAARKAYKKMAAHVGRPLKGTDVKKHPIIFRRSIPKSAGGLAKRIPQRAPAAVRKPVPTKRVAPAAAPVARKPARRVIDSIDAYLAGLADMTGQWFEDEEIEYVSTAEYKSKR